MKKVLTNNIIQNQRKMRFEKASLEHLMSAYEEGIEALLLALNCDPAEITILSGAVVDDSADPDFTVTAGWAAYDGEIFQVDAGAFTAAGGETAVWVIDETYLASDPVKFDDGNEFNVNQIRKLKLESGVAGSGVKDAGEEKLYSDSNWIVPTSLGAGVTVDTFAYRKRNGVVYFKGKFQSTDISSGGVVVTTLPVGYRPPATFKFMVNVDQVNKFLEIKTTGEIVASQDSPIDSSDFPIGQLSYIPA